MRLNPFILIATLIVGIGGLVMGIRAFATYDDAAEAFTRLELVYVADSFEWQSDDYETGTATFRITNGSSFPADIESFSIALQFDGDFAGSDYERWEPIIVPAGESRVIPATFTITSNSIQDKGGTAQLSFSGQVLARFAEFEQPLSFRFRGTIGPVEASDG